MQFEAQDAEYHARNPHGTFDVIEVAGRPAGRLYVDRRPGDIRIVDIALLPEFQGQGVGAHLIGLLMHEASSSGCMLSIHVEIHNRAAALYDRLGLRGRRRAGHLPPDGVDRTMTAPVASRYQAKAAS